MKNVLSIFTYIIILFGQFIFAQTDEDCVFNNDYKGLGKQWILDSKTNYKFTFNENTHQYIAKLSDGDSLELFRGGCVHFTIDLKYKTKKGKELRNKKYWLDIALKYAVEFELDLFVDVIKMKLYKLEEENDELLFFSIPTRSGNEISEGIIIKRENGLTTLSLNYYYN